MRKKKAWRPETAPEEPLESLSHTPPKHCQQRLPACQVPHAALGAACWPHVPRANTAMDGVLLDGDVQDMVIPSYIFSPPIFSENNYDISKNCLPFQQAQVKNKYQSKDVVRKERLSGVISLQEATLKTTQLEETEHTCDSRSQPLPWDPNWFHPFLCKIVPTRVGLAMLTQPSSRWWTSKAGGNEEWIIMHHNPV